MKLVVLGLKNKQDGSLHLYDVVSRRKNGIPVLVGDVLDKGPVAPFPFEIFSSLDYKEPIFKTHEPTYLLVNASLTTDEWESMRSGAQYSYHFDDKRIEVLAEFDTPFRYALEQLTEHGEHLGTYNLTTWLIHEAAKTDDEFEAMCAIIDAAMAHYAEKPYNLDLSLDKHVLTYLDHLLTFPRDSYTFGQYGYNELTIDEVKRADLSDEGLLALLEKTRLAHALVHHPHFDKGFYQRHIEPSPTLEAHLISYLDAEDLVQWQAIGFDMDYLFERYYQLAMTEPMYENDAYRNVNELVRDTQYTPLTKTHDPYEYYCCADCEGYEIDVDDDSYDYKVDEQVEALADLLHHWEGYLTKRSAPLFDNWSEDIFKRYRSEHPLPAFFWARVL